MSIIFITMCSASSLHSNDARSLYIYSKGIKMFFHIFSPELFTQFISTYVINLHAILLLFYLNKQLYLKEFFMYVFTYMVTTSVLIISLWIFIFLCVIIFLLSERLLLTFLVHVYCWCILLFLYIFKKILYIPFVFERYFLG